mmetsp:Transcript_14901/g.35520  ORF Transcript_14901/g.35520 Transcript_14901/m.35520 type:complete len:244 (+) Transcript_14901:351-1082(+)
MHATHQDGGSRGPFLGRHKQAVGDERTQIDGKEEHAVLLLDDVCDVGEDSVEVCGDGTLVHLVCQPCVGINLRHMSPSLKQPSLELVSVEAVLVDVYGPQVAHADIGRLHDVLAPDERQGGRATGVAERPHRDSVLGGLFLPWRRLALEQLEIPILTRLDQCADVLHLDFGGGRALAFPVVGHVWFFRTFPSGPSERAPLHLAPQRPTRGPAYLRPVDDWWLWRRGLARRPPATHWRGDGAEE